MADFSRIMVVAAMDVELSYCQRRQGVTYVVSGEGPAAIAGSLTEAILTHKPELVVQVGIAGAINKDIAMEEVCFVAEDYFGDMGGWHEGKFVSFDTEVYSTKSTLELPFRRTRGVTVSTACTPLIDRTGCDIETMEGAAFYKVCARYGVEALQIRSVSNYMDTPRAQWRMQEGFAALAPALDTVIDKWLSER